MRPCCSGPRAALAWMRENMRSSPTQWFTKFFAAYRNACPEGIAGSSSEDLAAVLCHSTAASRERIGFIEVSHWGSTRDGSGRGPSFTPEATARRQLQDG